MRGEEVNGDKESQRISDFREGTLVSFDIPQEHSTVRVALQRYLHGRTEIRYVNGRERKYRYPGLLDEGGYRFGQSVYLLPHDSASRLILKLRELNVRHRYLDVMADGRVL